jgi:uncharacterized protein (TIGR02145 family)
MDNVSAEFINLNSHIHPGNSNESNAMKNNIIPAGSIIILIVIISLVSCEKNSLPFIGTTTRVTDITMFTAVVKGYVVADGGSPVTSKGICWDTLDDPTKDNFVLEAEEGVGGITCKMTVLRSGTTYYVRSFATNRAGTAYSNVTKFSTTKLPLPGVYTEVITYLKPRSAHLGVQAESNDGFITKKGICWGTEPNPTISINTAEISRGYIWRYIGNLIPSTTYYVRGYAYNSTGLAYGSQQVFKTYNDSVMDIDNNIYYTILFGNKVWMGSNLKVTRYNNGESVETTTLPWTTIESETEPGYQWAYDGTGNNVTNYGRLYTWYATADGRKLCPSGWHIPTDEEWTDLINQLGGESVAGGKMKFDPRYWNYNNVPYSQDGGFDAPGAGMRKPDGTFLNLGLSTMFWSSSSSSPADAYSRRIDVSSPVVTRAAGNKSSGFSIRCVKD